MALGKARRELLFNHLRPRIERELGVDKGSLKLDNLSPAHRGRIHLLLRSIEGRLREDPTKVLRAKFPTGHSGRNPLSHKAVASELGLSRSDVGIHWDEASGMIVTHLAGNFDPSHPSGIRGNSGVVEKYPALSRKGSATHPLPVVNRVAREIAKQQIRNFKFSPVQNPDDFLLLFVEPRNAGQQRPFDSWSDFVSVVEG